jgi:hypothetical protein
MIPQTKGGKEKWPRIKKYGKGVSEILRRDALCGHDEEDDGG